MGDVAHVDLKHLIGLHDLTGCDLLVEKVERYDSTEDANVIRFTLDGRTYTAVEDPSDGYRSSMDRIFVEDVQLKNTFPAVRVFAHMKGRDGWHDNETLQLLDLVTGKIVLEVGTDNSDDYYPSFVGAFSPENMAINASPPAAPDYTLATTAIGHGEVVESKKARRRIRQAALKELNLWAIGDDGDYVAFSDAEEGGLYIGVNRSTHYISREHAARGGTL